MRTTGLLFSLILLAAPRLAVAQAQSAPSARAVRQAAAAAEARTMFAALKGLAGTWTGSTVMFPRVPSDTVRDSTRVTLRVLSRGHTLVQEMHGATVPEDPTRFDHPLTVIYLNDDGRLTLTHYCDAGNRPRMVARVSPDGKTIDFDFLDISGRYDRTGHMQHARFTLIDADHHTEDWTYLMPDHQLVRAHVALQREPVAVAAGGR